MTATRSILKALHLSKSNTAIDRYFSRPVLYPLIELDPDSPRRSRVTLDGYVGHCEKFLPWAQESGLKTIDDITDEVIAEYLKHELNQGKSETTVRHRLIALKVALKPAVRKGWLDDNPADGLKGYRPNPPSPRVFSPDEIGQMLFSFEGDLLDLVILCYYQAMRRSEALFLRWEDIDFENDEIHIRPHGKEEGIPAWTPKSGAGTRTLPLFWQVKHQLLTKEHTGTHVFHHIIQGRSQAANTVTKQFQAACRKVGIPYRNGKAPRLHHLRDTRLTEMATMPGMSAFALAGFAGHSSTSITQKYYVRVNAKTIGDIVGKAESGGNGTSQVSS